MAAISNSSASNIPTRPPAASRGPRPPPPGPDRARAVELWSGAQTALDQARYLLDRGQAFDARNILNQALAAGQDGAPLRSLLGLILHQLGDLSGCEQQLRRAVELTPND